MVTLKSRCMHVLFDIYKSFCLILIGVEELSETCTHLTVLRHISMAHQKVFSLVESKYISMVHHDWYVDIFLVHV